MELIIGPEIRKKLSPAQKKAIQRLQRDIAKERRAFNQKMKKCEQLGEAIISRHQKRAEELIFELTFGRGLGLSYGLHTKLQNYVEFDMRKGLKKAKQ